jgi:hypothetical protein
MAERMTALEAYRAGILTLPSGYELEDLADVVLLRRDNGTLVSGFGASRVIPVEVAWAAEQDRRMRARRSAPRDDPSRWSKDA